MIVRKLIEKKASELIIKTNPKTLAIEMKESFPFDIAMRIRKSNLNEFIKTMG